MSSFLLEIVFAFLSAFPGIVVVSKLFRWRIMDARSVILGILFWDFLFASLSIVVGCTSIFLNYFFYVFTGASVVISVWWLVKKLAKKRHLQSFRFALSMRELPLVSLIAVLLVFVALVMAFHLMFVENDALWLYFPYAKGLVSSRGFWPNAFFASSAELTKMPLMSTYYAWGLSVFGTESFRLIPFTFIMLVLFVVYKISEELIPDRREISYVAPAVFLTLPVILVSVSLYAFYVDLPLMAFTAASVFCSIMALKYNEAKWYLFAGLSAALAILSKESGYIAFIISLCIISLQFSKKYRLLSLLVAASPFYFFIIRNSIILSPSNPLFMVNVVFKQVPIVVLLILLASILFYVSNGNSSLNRGSLKKIFFFLIPSSLVLFFILRNWFFFGTPMAYSGFTVSTVGLNEQPTFLTFLRFDLLFDSTGLGNIFLIVVILGLVYIVKTLISKRNPEMATLGMWIILLLMDWSFFYNFQFTIAEIRRLLIVSPFSSMIAAIGFSFLFNRLSKQNTKRGIAFFFAWLFCFLVLICTSVFQLAFVRLAGTYLSYIVFPMSEDLFTLPTFLVSLLIPLIIVLLIYLGNKTGFFGKLSKPYKLYAFSHRRKIGARALSSVALIAIILVSLVPLNVLQMIANVNNSHWDSDEYAKKAVVSSWWDFMPEIIDFYNSSLLDNYTTVSYGSSTTTIAYFLDRSVVNIDQGVYGYSFLESNSTEELLNSLYASNIRYFLIPNENAASYPQYMAVSSRLLLFRLISDRDHFFLLKDFPCYSLYKLVLPSDKQR